LFPCTTNGNPDCKQANSTQRRKRNKEKKEEEEEEEETKCACDYLN